MRLLFLMVFVFSFCVLQNVKAQNIYPQTNNKYAQTTEVQNKSQLPNNINISKNLRRKMKNASKMGGGAGGYLTFDRKGYKQDNQTSNSSARRRFSFVNPNSFGTLKQTNGTSSYNSQLKKSNPFAIDKYVVFEYSNAIQTTLKSNKQYGGTNSNAQPLQKSYGFSVGYGTRLFDKTKFNTTNYNKSRSYNTIDKRAVFGKRPANKMSIKVNNTFNSLKDKLNNFKINTADFLGENLLFSEFSANIMFNEFRGTPNIANSTPVNKSFGGIYLSEKIILMPKALNTVVNLPRGYSIPLSGFIFPEIGYGIFSYKNILSYDKTLINNSGQTPKDEVIKQSKIGLIYGFGGGIIMDMSNILKAQNSVFLRMEIKYLQVPSFAVSTPNVNLQENISFSNTSFNTSLVINLN